MRFFVLLVALKFILIPFAAVAGETIDIAFDIDGTLVSELITVSGEAPCASLLVRGRARPVYLLPLRDKMLEALLRIPEVRLSFVSDSSPRAIIVKISGIRFSNETNAFDHAHRIIGSHGTDKRNTPSKNLELVVHPSAEGLQSAIIVDNAGTSEEQSKNLVWGNEASEDILGLILTAISNAKADGKPVSEMLFKLRTAIETNNGQYPVAMKLLGRSAMAATQQSEFQRAILAPTEPADEISRAIDFIQSDNTPSDQKRSAMLKLTAPKLYQRLLQTPVNGEFLSYVARRIYEWNGEMESTIAESTQEMRAAARQAKDQINHAFIDALRNSLSNQVTIENASVLAQRSLIQTDKSVLLPLLTLLNSKNISFMAQAAIITIFTEILENPIEIPDESLVDFLLACRLASRDSSMPVADEKKQRLLAEVHKIIIMESVGAFHWPRPANFKAWRRKFGLFTAILAEDREVMSTHNMTWLRGLIQTVLNPPDYMNEPENLRPNKQEKKILKNLAALYTQP